MLNCRVVIVMFHTMTPPKDFAPVIQPQMEPQKGTLIGAKTKPRGDHFKFLIVPSKNVAVANNWMGH